jgi:glycosyltransferase involved in cell wall biosynthesis
MWNYIHKYKGIIVLHDFNLHEAFYKYCFVKENQNFHLYEKILACDINSDLVNKYISDLKGSMCDPKITEYEVNRFLTDFAEKIIVHSNNSKRRLLEADISKNVRAIKLYGKKGNDSNASILKKKYGFHENEMIFSSFGIVHHSKRIIPLIKAFARFNKEFMHIKFIFVGEIASGFYSEIQKLLLEYSIEDKIVFTGYVKLKTMFEYMDMADVCFNLRFPYNGETSAALMRLLARGKCVVINDIGSFSEIPDAVCVKLPDVKNLTEEKEVGILYSTMSLLLNPEKRNKISSAAKQYADQFLNLEVITKQYYDFIYDKPDECSLNNKILEKISDEIQKRTYSFDQIKTISLTLGYIKNPVQKDGVV